MTREYVRALARYPRPRIRDVAALVRLGIQAGRNAGAEGFALAQHLFAGAPRRDGDQAHHDHVDTAPLSHLLCRRRDFMPVGPDRSSIISYAICSPASTVDGWTSLIISIWFFGGLTTLILGILGIYIANILSESKRRPYTVVRRVYRASEEAETASNIAHLGARARRKQGAVRFAGADRHSRTRGAILRRQTYDSRRNGARRRLEQRCEPPPPAPTILAAVGLMKSRQASSISDAGTAISSAFFANTDFPADLWDTTSRPR